MAKAKRDRTAGAGRPAAGAARLLVVDDAAPTLEVLQRNLSSAGYRVQTAPGVAEAVRILEGSSIDLVITDLKMPGAGGLELTRHVRENFKHTEIMIITGYPSVESAVQAVKDGAEEYLSKPFTDEELLAAVARVLEKLNSRSALAPARRDRWARYGLMGESPQMQQAIEVVTAAAATRRPILISGEPGTGKEAVARAIHDHGPCAAGPFVTLRCDALPEDRLEAELLGGRMSRGPSGGLLRSASGGTLYLAALDDVPPRTQEKLARRLSGRGPLPRLIGGGAEDLPSLVDRGLFLRALLDHLAPPRVHLPPLRDRGEDVVLLALHLAARFAGEWGSEPIRFDDHALLALRGYAWPGNVRELRAVVHRLCFELPGGLVRVVDLPPKIRFRFAGRPDLGADRRLEEVEAEHIRNTISATAGNKARAAEMLGIDRKTLREKLRRYGLA